MAAVGSVVDLCPVDCQCLDCRPVDDGDDQVTVCCYTADGQPHNFDALWCCLLTIPHENWPRC